MNLNKSLEYFNPLDVKDMIHIIGVGAIGSTLLMHLVRLGLTRITIWDYDRVESHNLVNQYYSHQDIGEYKVDAAIRIAKEINPDINIFVRDEWQNEVLAGHVFLAVDSIETRFKILEKNFYNPRIRSMWDFRLRVEDAQHYAALWTHQGQKDKLKGSMNFTSEEAVAATPVNACGMSLSVMPTVELICSLGIANFMNHINGRDIRTMVMANTFNGIINQI